MELWQPHFLARTSKEATDFQRDEQMYYIPCAFCQRTIYQIRQQGVTEVCARYPCGGIRRRPA